MDQSRVKPPKNIKKSTYYRHRQKNTVKIFTAEDIIAMKQEAKNKEVGSSNTFQLPDHQNDPETFNGYAAEECCQSSVYQDDPYPIGISDNYQEDLGFVGAFDEINSDDELFYDYHYKEDINFNELLPEELRKNLLKDLRLWNVEFNIRHTAMNKLIEIINKYWKNTLPKDSRTLMQTPSKVEIKTFEGKETYWHQGLEFCLQNYCAEYIKDLNKISLNFSLDGLPIYKSSKEEFWPILFTIQEVPSLRPNIIGIFSGKSKPKDVNQFLSPFIDEIKAILSKGGVKIGENVVEISVRSFIMDSPAKALIKETVNFNHKNGCSKCNVVGEYSYDRNCVFFPANKGIPRTDTEFRQKVCESYHKFDSRLLELPIDIVADIPVGDSLHLLDLGVMKRCILGWRDGTFQNYRTRWSAQMANEITNFLTSVELPSEIHRKVRGLDHLSFWKGLEFRSFFLYVGVVILRRYLPEDAYQNFLTLFCAVTIFSSRYYNSLVDVADLMIQNFVFNFSKIYGEDHITSNFHNVLHIPEEVKKFGTLDSFSSYVFESKLFQIKNLIKTGKNPLSQVAKRLVEISLIESETAVSEPENNKISLKKINDGLNVEESLLLRDKIHYKFYYQIGFENNFILNNELKNQWFLTKQNEVVSLQNVLILDEKIYLYGLVVKEKYLFFKEPIKSSSLNIFCSNFKDYEKKTFSIKDIKCKLVYISDDGTDVFIH